MLKNRKSGGTYCVGGLAAVGGLTAVGGLAYFTCNFSILGGLAVWGTCCAFLGGGTCCAPAKVEVRKKRKYIFEHLKIFKNV